MPENAKAAAGNSGQARAGVTELPTSLAQAPKFDLQKINAYLEELAERDQWVPWRWEWRDDKWTKVLYNPTTGRRAKVNVPETWGSLFDAAKRSEHRDYAGIGYVVSDDDPFTVIDVDDCRNPETGELTDAAQWIMEMVPGYWEPSVSGDGIHGITEAAKPGKRCRRGSIPGVEIYDNVRFLTVLGKPFPEHRFVSDGQAGVNQLYAELWPDPEPKPTNGARPPSQPGVPSDSDLLAKATTAANSPKFNRLMAGDFSGYESQSEADQALCNILAYWTRDPKQINRLFQQSGLYRDKWDREDYSQNTISNALEYVTDWYEWDRRTMERDEEPRATPAEERPKRNLQDVVSTFRKHLHLPDPTSLYVLFGATIANYFDADPIWLMLVGPPGGGKTEQLNALAEVPRIHHAATLTEAALLSGTPKKEAAKGARGGLLRQIDDFGLIVCKDFTSILSMHRETRAGVLAALREVYDGSWTRHLGTDGGRTLSWQGKVGMLAGVTPAIDSHHSVIGAMGERFVMYRLRATAEESERQAQQALINAGGEDAMRQELAEVVAGLFASVDVPSSPDPLPEDLRNRMVKLAALVARCRSAVERHSHSREITMVPEPESPGRLARQLAMLYAGIRVIGVEEDTAWTCIQRVGLDSMPALRRRVLTTLAAEPDEMTTTSVAAAISHPTETARRALEELEAHHVVIRTKTGAGKPDEWGLAEWSRTYYERTSPEMSEGVSTNDSSS